MTMQVTAGATLPGTVGNTDPRLPARVLMKRRRAIAVVVGVAFLAGIAVAVCLWMRPEVLPIEQALYHRVHLGMTEAEVSAAIPYSPGDHCGTYTYGTGGPLREGELPMGIG